MTVTKTTANKRNWRTNTNFEISSLITNTSIFKVMQILNGYCQWIVSNWNLEFSFYQTFQFILTGAIIVLTKIMLSSKLSSRNNLEKIIAKLH